MNAYSPPVRTQNQNLPIQEMSWEAFERLCLDIVVAVDGYHITECRSFGAKGQNQSGIDLYASNNSGDYSTYQCKQIQTLTPGYITQIVETFKKGKWFDKSSRFVICFSCQVIYTHLLNEFEDVKSELAGEGILLEMWDQDVINRRLKAYPEIVYDYFGEHWCRFFCGDEVYDREIAKKKLLIPEILSQFRTASAELVKIPGVFGKGHHHINRDETQTLSHWLDQPISVGKEALAVLEGGAGLGKTIILKDLYQILQSRGIPVIAIKSDRFEASNIPELETKLFGRSDFHLVDSMHTLSLRFDTIVVLIDQIDALSMSLSSHRSFMTTYTGLIQQLLCIPQVRIIFSARTFDLDYDQDLKTFRDTMYTQVKARRLGPEQVKAVLAELGVHRPSGRLVELLRNPNHLNMFCMLDDPNGHSALLITSHKQLFDAVWSSIMDKANDSRRLKHLLFELARKMNDGGVLILPNIYREDYKDELHYALSNQVITSESRGLGFFHQTFYEYVFARQFVDGGSDIIKYIAAQHQGIYIRSVVKLVTDYLREVDTPNYVKTMTQLLGSSDTRFHLKILIIAGFSTIQVPNDQEYKLLKSVILTNDKYTELFLNAMRSNGWYHKLLRAGDLKQLYDYGRENSEFAQYSQWALGVYNTHFAENINESINFYKTLDSSHNLDDTTEWVLSNLLDWSDKRLLEFFDQHFQYETGQDSNNYQYIEILKRIASFNLPFVLERIGPIFELLLEDRLRGQSNAQEDEALAELYERYPEEVFSLLFENISIVMERTKASPMERDFNYPFNSTVFYDDSGNHDYLDNFQSKAMEICERHLISKARTAWFDHFFDLHVNSSFLALLRMLIITLTKSPEPEKAAKLIKILKNKNLFYDWDSDIQKDLRKMAGVNFPLMSIPDQQGITEVFLSIKRPGEYSLWKYREEDMDRKPKSAGSRQFTYLKSLPFSEVMANQALRKRVCEWHRKFIGPGMPENWDSMEEFTQPKGPNFDRLSWENWKNIMKTYNLNSFSSLESAFENRNMFSRIEQAFEATVSLNPDAYFVHVAELFAEEKTYELYLRAALRGLIKGKYNPVALGPLYEQHIARCKHVHDFASAFYDFDYFSASDSVTGPMFEFAMDVVIRHDEIEKMVPNNVVSWSDRIHIGQRALSAVMSCYKHVAFQTEILTLADTITIGSDIELRITLMSKFSNLWNINHDRAFSVFRLLTETGDDALMKESFRHAIYLKNERLEDMHDYFNRIIKNNELITEESIKIFFNGYFMDQSELLPYVEQLIKPGSLVLGRCVKAIENHLLKEPGKGLEMLSRLVIMDSEAMARDFAALILRKFKSMSFEVVLPFLRIYNQSPSVQRDPGYYFQYLLTQVGEHPYECHELLAGYDFRRVLRSRGSMDKLPAQLLLAIYTTLSSRNTETRYLEQLMDIFDHILLSGMIRSKADEVIEAIDH